MGSPVTIANRLEQYTLKQPNEVLLVKIETAGQPDEILIFKGFSSSLMKPTAFDPDIPVIADNAKICQIDRLHSPYNPAAPRYIERALSLADFEKYLIAQGLKD